MASKKQVVRCGVCGCKATRFIGIKTLPVCNNVVCYHTRIEEVNTELKKLKYQKETEV